MAAVADSPARNRGQRSSRSIWMRTGTRCATWVNSPETTFRGLEGTPGLVDRPLLDPDQQFDLADLVVAGLRKVYALGRFLFRLLCGLDRPSSDVDLRP